MSVDAMVSRAALHVTGTLHSSSAVKGRADLDRGRVLSMELDVPEEKMEIFDIRSVELFLWSFFNLFKNRQGNGKLYIIREDFHRP